MFACIVFENIATRTKQIGSTLIGLQGQASDSDELLPSQIEVVSQFVSIQSTKLRCHSLHSALNVGVNP